MKAMLACSTIPDLNDIQYPVIASPKLDGIRCLMIDGVAMSRNGKPIPNKHVQNKLKGLHGLDGELMVKGDFNSVQSAIMSEQGTPEFYYCVFDAFNNPTHAFSKRRNEARILVKALALPHVRAVEQHLVYTPSDLEELWHSWTSEGYEGAIIRSLNGPYKFGRSTMKQGYMLKLKSFEDDEARIVDVEELMHNADTSTKQQANLIPGRTLGALVVEWNGERFKIGSGFNAEQRQRLWSVRTTLINDLVTFKYQGVSAYGIPRFPIFKSLRRDL